MAASHQNKTASGFQKALNDTWEDAEVANKYKKAENLTRPFARIVVDKSGLAQSSSAYVFDLATGTGAAVKELYDAVPRERWEQLKVLGGDVSVPMLESLKKRGEEEGWIGLETQVVDGNNLELPANTYTHIFVSFGIFVMPGALPKLYELLKPGGFIGITTWASLPWHPLLVRSIDKMKTKEKPYLPSAAEVEDKLYAGRPWASNDYITAQLSEAGFKNVGIVTEKKLGSYGTPEEFMDTMQFAFNLVAVYWEESKREGWLQELRGLVLEEAIKEAVGVEQPEVKFEMEGHVGWGWKNS